MPEFRFEAKFYGVPVDQARPELQRYRACQFIVRDGEVAVIPDSTRTQSFGCYGTTPDNYCAC